MFEREIKFIYDFNLNKVNKLGPYFTFEQLSAVELHPAILNYISAEIDYIIFEDRQKLLKDSIFDYSGEKISYYFSLINEEIKKTKRLSFEYVSKLILHATSFTINYLVRPKWTLKKFIFDEGEHRTSSEIKQILNYVYYYNYLKKILISYINSKKILSMNLQEFSVLLDKIDNIGLETNLMKILNSALNSMAEFFNIGELQKNKIPLSAIELFLEEKNLNEHLRRLKVVFGDDKTLKCNIKDIQKELSFVLMGEELPFEEKQVQTEEKPTEAEDEDKKTTDEIKIKELEEELYEENEYEQKDYESDVLEKNTLEENEKSGQENDEIIEEESEEMKEKNEDEVSISYKPQKFRIRVDKNNEIEPLYEEENKNEKENLQEEITISANLLEKKDLISEDELEKEEKINREENLETAADNNFIEINIDEREDEQDTLRTIFNHVDDEDKKESQIEKSIFSYENPDASEEIISEDKAKLKSINLNEMMEDKEVTKIIETIFDYDVEDFSNVLDSISNCSTLEEAFQVIDKVMSDRNYSTKSKEAELFKSIISEYFKNT